MDITEYTSAFLLYAPAKDPQAWHLDLAGFSEALQAAFPEVRCVPEDRPAALSFWALTNEGVVFDGFADVETRHTIMLTENTATEASEFIVWLRDHYLPSPDLIRYTTEDAVTRGLDTDWRVPSRGGREQIVEELEQHLRVVTS
ncbi:hypothetical protein ACWFR5_26080 [Streptomyces sp. NPDC055092]|uniref:hypothetical protein n=1 Tax=Streptomyces sp. NPDC127172 TaxID=3345382 RepID=UPI003642A081